MNFKTYLRTCISKDLYRELIEEERKRIAEGQRERTYYMICFRYFGKKRALEKASELLHTPKKWSSVASRAHALEKYLSRYLTTGKVVIGFNPNGDYTISLVSVEDEYRRGR